MTKKWKKSKKWKNKLLNSIPRISYKSINSINKSKVDKWDFSKKKIKKVLKIKT